MQEFGGFLGMGGGTEDRAFIALQHFQPACQIGGVILAHVGGDTQIGDQFFHGVAFIPPMLAPEVAVKPRRVARPVRGFVQAGAVIAFRVLEEFKGGQGDAIRSDRIKCPITAMSDGCAGVGQKLLGMVDALRDAELRFLRGGVVMRVENGFQYLPLLSTEFSSHKIYMCHNINMIVVSCWKI